MRRGINPGTHPFFLDPVSFIVVGQRLIGALTKFDYRACDLRRRVFVRAVQPVVWASRTHEALRPEYEALGQLGQDEPASG